MSDTLPTRWDLANVYPGLDSTKLAEDFQKIKLSLDETETYFNNQVSGVEDNGDAAQIAAVISHMVERLNQLLELSGTVRAYIQSFVATDSFNQPARKLLSQFEMVSLRLQKLSVKVESWLGKLLPQLPEILQHTGAAQEHAFFVTETAEQSKYLMRESEEMLAAELNLSGATAWAKLQGTITSQLSVNFELDGKIQKLSMPALINLHSHPDESVRRRAYETELATWESAKESLAAAMNSIKGTVNTLYRRRNREDALHESIDNARIDRPTLEAMLSAMNDSFPMFRGYFKTKAKRLGKEKLAWWDIFAPAGKNKRTYTFADGREFILKHFARFSPELSSMAEYAFDHNWIDAEQRVGKRGGAFCMSVPGVKESRILCNFDGTLDQVSTIAHELGHAFHNYCMFKAGKTPLQRNTPMTLAETASIMCETIIVEAALAEAGSRDEELAILETSLIGYAQVA
jgi:pepF/M3 family oligoendopeptidase